MTEGNLNAVSARTRIISRAAFWLRPRRFWSGAPLASSQVRQPPIGEPARAHARSTQEGPSSTAGHCPARRPFRSAVSPGSRADRSPRRDRTRSRPTAAACGRPSWPGAWGARRRHAPGMRRTALRPSQLGVVRDRLTPAVPLQVAPAHAVVPERRDDLLRVVGAPVANHQELQIGVGLPEHRADRVSQDAAPVVRRDHDADQRVSLGDRVRVGVSEDLAREGRARPDPPQKRYGTTSLSFGSAHLFGVLVVVALATSAPASLDTSMLIAHARPVQGLRRPSTSVSSMRVLARSTTS